MRNERYSWSVCDEQDGVWDPIGTHEARREAEAELRAVLPKAFLVRITKGRATGGVAEGLSGAHHVRAGRTGVPHPLMEGGLTRANAFGKWTSCRRDGAA